MTDYAQQCGPANKMLAQVVPCAQGPDGGASVASVASVARFDAASCINAVYRKKAARRAAFRMNI
ncbi:hypothetical protein CBW46_007960 [Paenibacillus xerothermodurans]|uniref:Uncharacterized protein n=1 Tax=Paenibacillus xerothermodurans TaxID=1977292 RepID=A0A2W1NQZ7_PAEXE|nr:hypothetical protein CBW46_007960 [Paenibacillus xerothermodurans]